MTTAKRTLKKKAAKRMIVAKSYGRKAWAVGKARLAAPTPKGSIRASSTVKALRGRDMGIDLVMEVADESEGSALREVLSGAEFVEAKPTQKRSSGFMIKQIRELQGLSQAKLAEIAKMTQAAISALENGTQTLGLDRAKALATALKVHPAVLAFPDWDGEEKVG